MLADRAAAGVSLDNEGGAFRLLEVLQEMDARDQTGVLADRIAAQIFLDEITVPVLVEKLRRAGAQRQAKTLIQRLPGAGMFHLFQREQNDPARYWFGREADGSPAAAWTWEDLQ